MFYLCVGERGGRRERDRAKDRETETERKKERKKKVCVWSKSRTYSWAVQGEEKLNAFARGGKGHESSRAAEACAHFTCRRARIISCGVNTATYREGAKVHQTHKHTHSCFLTRFIFLDQNLPLQEGLLLQLLIDFFTN